MSAVGRLPLKWIAIFTVAVNLLMIVPPLHMLQVYDRVLTSNSLETLIYITLIAVAALVLYGVAETVRGKLAHRASAQYTIALSDPIFSKLSRNKNAAGGATQVLRDFNSVRSFISSRALMGLFDLPFAPFFIFLMFLLHWSLGVLTLIGLVALLAVALLNKTLTASNSAASKKLDMEALTFAQTVFMRAEDIRAMGLLPAIMTRWGNRMADALQAGDVAANQTATFYGISKSVRKIVQIVIMAWAAYLAIRGDISAGVIFASSMLTARALTPIEQVIGSWDRITHARMAHDNLKQFLADGETPADTVRLPDPTGQISVQGLVYNPSAGSSARPILDEISFELEAGKILAIIGPSGAGKSTLARALVGAITPDSGQVMLDGAQRSQWPEHQWGESVGYVSQEVTLFPASLAENIARLEVQPDSEKVVAAAQAAGVHEMITALPDGYSTEIGPGKLILSGGQKQRLALARALYSDPKVLVLDEPNAHLDAHGETALMAAMQRAREAGRTIIVVTQRRSVLKIADWVMTIRDGRITDYSRPLAQKPGGRQRLQVEVPPLETANGVADAVADVEAAAGAEKQGDAA